MADEVGIYVDQDGFPTPLLITRWRAKGARTALQIAPIVDEDGMALPGFQALWRKAFPVRPPLPPAPIVTPAGMFSEAMLQGCWL